MEAQHGGATLHQTAPLPHVAVVPTPGMGHLIPLVEFSKRLVLQHNFHVTIIIPNDGSSIKAQQELLASLPSDSISSVFLPPVSFDDFPHGVDIEARITLTLTRSIPVLRERLKVFTESTRLVALVVDLFGTTSFEIAKELGIPPYIFFPSTAMALSTIIQLPELDEKTRKYNCDFKDLPELIRIPGCVPFHGRDLLDPTQKKNSEGYKWAIHMAKLYPSATGIIVNSFTELEPAAFKGLGEIGFKLPVYPVGPLVQTGSTNQPDRSGCLNWLDTQPFKSVLFVCFGSGGTLSQYQINELAFGLEMSGQRFLWMVRAPHDKAASAAYFDVGSFNGNTDGPDFLPEGFLDRTKNVGLVVQNWVPQAQVLAHDSTGGFLSHCGWNSSLESIVSGVPMIAWPLYAEQKMNAVLLTEGLTVAFRVKAKENGLVDREDIATYAKALIEGEKGKPLRERMIELKGAAKMALGPYGSSTKSLANVADIWKKLNI